MDRLANSIERLVKQGDIGQGSFLDRFFQGFLRGISMSREFRKMMITLRHALRETFMAGRRLGMFFVKEFPGVSEVFKGIADMFNPRRWRKMLDGVVGAFRTFFQSVTTDPRAGLQTLFKQLKAAFFDNFDLKKEAGRRILGGIITFYKTVFRTGGELIKLGIEQIGQSFRNLFIGGTIEHELLEGAQSMIGEFMNFMGSIDYVGIFMGFVDAAAGAFDAIVSTFEDFIIPSLTESVSSFDIGALFDTISEGVQKAVPTILNAVSRGFSSLGDLFAQIPWDELSEQASAAFSSLKKTVIAALAQAVTAAQPVIEEFFRNTGKIINELPWEEIMETIWDGLVFLFRDIPTALRPIFDTVLAGLLLTVGRVIKGMITGLWAQVTSWFTGVLSRTFNKRIVAAFFELKNGVGGVMEETLEFVTGIFVSIGSRLTEGMSAIIGIFGELPGLASGALAGIGSAFISLFGTKVLPFVSGVQKAFTGAFNFLQNTVFAPMFTFLEERFGSLKTFIDEVITNIRNIGGGIAEILGLTGDSTTTVVSSLAAKTVADTQDAMLRSTLAASQKTTEALGGAADAQTQVIQAAIGSQSGAMKAGAEEQKGIFDSLLTSFRSASEISKKSVSGIAGGGLGDDSDETLRKAEGLRQLSSMSLPTERQIRRIQERVEMLRSTYVDNVAMGISDLVTSVNAVATDLGRLGDSPQRINLQLRELANSLGVGGSQRLEIKNRNFTLSLNVNVVLEADEFEETLIARPGGSRFEVKANI